MPKNDWLHQQQAKIDLMMEQQRLFIIQLMTDYSVLAFASLYMEKHGNEDVPEELAKEFIETLQNVMTEFSSNVREDGTPKYKGGNGDKTLQFSKGYLDRELRRVIHDYPDWEERFGK